jgi:hypothetical protein
VISDLDARHRHDHTRLTHVFGHTHPDLERDAVHDAEQPSTGSTPTTASPPTSTAASGAKRSRIGEAALALGVRVTVHDSRQNDRNPVIWQPGQDYRAADAIQTARSDPVRTRRGPERTGPER